MKQIQRPEQDPRSSKLVQMLTFLAVNLILTSRLKMELSGWQDLRTGTDSIHVSFGY
jgi:hypothetical protein